MQKMARGSGLFIATLSPTALHSARTEAGSCLARGEGFRTETFPASGTCQKEPKSQDWPLTKATHNCKAYYSVMTAVELRPYRSMVPHDSGTEPRVNCVGCSARSPWVSN